MSVIGEPREPVAGLERLAEEAVYLKRPSSLWRTLLRRLFRRKTGVVGLVIIGFWALVAIFAPLLATHDPHRGLLGDEEIRRREAPCVHALGCEPGRPQHLLGVDGNARDVYSRIIYGSRVSLTIGLSTVTAAILVGVTLGAIAGYWGGWLGSVIMRIMDVVLGFPSLLLAIAIVAVLGPGLRNALLAIAIVATPQ